MSRLEEKDYAVLKVPAAHVPKHILDYYDAHDLITPDGFIYVLVQGGMYGLPHAGILANQQLEKI